jgi:hypothetical protein
MLIEILGMEYDNQSITLHQKHHTLIKAGWLIKTTLAHQWYERGIILPYESSFVQQTLSDWLLEN